MSLKMPIANTVPDFRGPGFLDPERFEIVAKLPDAEPGADSRDNPEAAGIFDLPEGHMLVLDRGMAHDVAAIDDSAFLLTIAWPEEHSAEH